MLLCLMFNYWLYFEYSLNTHCDTFKTTGASIKSSSCIKYNGLASLWLFLCVHMCVCECVLTCP